MIYIVEKMNFIHDESDAQRSENMMMRLLPLLSDERKQKALSYHFYKDRLNSAMVYVLLRYGLKKEYGADERPEFIYNTEGKPYLESREDIYFNFSHCKGVVTCMLSDTEAGIDVQESFNFETGIMEQICSRNEKALFAKTKDKDRLLNRLWVLKEAYTKYLGTGMRVDFKKIDFSEEVFSDASKIKGTVFESKACFLRIVEKETYCIAVCSNQAEHELVYMTMHELLTCS